MYIPSHFAEADVERMHALMRGHPFATWVVELGGELVANHIPMLVDGSRGEFGTLVGHVSRANPVWRRLAGAGESLAMFQGPQAYISPGWYASKREHGKVVPTWNYAVVHARGVARTIEDRDWLLRHVNELSNTHEAGEEAPWKVSDAPAEFIEQMLRGIVGIEIPISRIEGKWKLGQNRNAADRTGMAEGLRARGADEASALADLVCEKVEGI